MEFSRQEYWSWLPFPSWPRDGTQVTIWAIGKGEKERYTHLNAEFQRIARKDKKALPSEQFKQIEKSNRMGKTRDLFQKVRDTKGIFHAKMGTIDRNGMDITEAEDIKKRWQEHTDEPYKKILMTQIAMVVWSFTQSQTS